MRLHLRLPLLVTLTCCGALAQGVQNQDIAILAGPASIGTRVLSGTNVTLNGQTAVAAATIYGYQVARISGASLWIEFSPGTFLLHGRGTASIPGVVSNTLSAYTAGARLMLPLQSRISVYGLAGGGGGSFHYAVLATGTEARVTYNNTFHGLFVFGGGADIRLTRHLSIRGEIRDLVTGRGLSGANGRHHVLPLFGPAFHF